MRRVFASVWVGVLLAASVGMLSSANAQQTNTLGSHTDWVRDVTFSPGGRYVAAASRDGTLQVISLQTRSAVRVFRDSTQRFRSVAFSPDGKMLAAAGTGGQALLLKLATGDTLRTDTEKVGVVTFAPSGQTLAMARSDGDVQLWSKRSGEVRRTLTGHAGVVYAVAFSPDGDLVATGGEDGTARLWEAKTGRLIRVLRRSTGSVMSLNFCPRGDTLALGRWNNVAELYSVRTGTRVATLRGHSDTVRDVVFSPDGQQVATGSYDGQIIVWNTKTQKRQHAIQAHSGSVYSIAFSPDGQWLASGGSDDAARLWRTTPAVMKPVQRRSLASLTLRAGPADSLYALPEGSELLVLRGSSNTPSTLAESRVVRRQVVARLKARATYAPGRLLDSLRFDGTTNGKYAVATALYVLARTPEGRLYESSVLGEAGFDRTTTGDLQMRAVPGGAQQRMRRAFRRVQQTARTTSLTPTENGKRLPRGTEVHVWAQHGIHSKQLHGRTPWSRDATARTTLTSDGETRDRFSRTWHSGSVLYVAARTPDGKLYESGVKGQSGFRVVDRAAIAMVPVPQGEHHVALERAFVPPGPPSAARRIRTQLSGAFGVLLSACFGLIVGVSGFWWWRKHEEERHGDAPASAKSDAKDASTDSTLQDQVESLQSKHEEDQQRIQTLEEELKRARTAKTVSSLSSDTKRETDSESEKGAAPSEAPSDHERSDTSGDASAEAIGEAFADWCGSDGPMVGRYYMFESALQETVPDAQVSRIYHDARTDDRFGADVSDVSGEFWLVALPSEAVLLPVPKRDGTFRALAPAFDADDAAVAHTDIETVLPAQLAAADSGYRIRSTGTLR